MLKKLILRSSKTSAEPACLPSTCGLPKCGGCPQIGCIGTGHLLHMQPQAVSPWKMFCRKAVTQRINRLRACRMSRDAGKGANHTGFP